MRKLHHGSDPTGSTVYKDVAVGFFTTIVNLKRAPPRVGFVVFKSSDGCRRLTWGPIRVGRSPPIAGRMARKRKHHEIGT